MNRAIVALAAALVVACGGALAPSPDAAPQAPVDDAGAPDAGQPDADAADDGGLGVAVPDGAPADAQSDDDADACRWFWCSKTWIRCDAQEHADCDGVTVFCPFDPAAPACDVWATDASGICE